jgi:hypothetical protein
MVGDPLSCNNVQLSFDSVDTDTGFCWAGDGDMRWIANGLDRVSIASAVNTVFVGGGVGTNLYVSGTVASCTIGNGTGTTSCSSDSRLKQNIQNPGSASDLQKVIALNPATYTWLSDGTNRTRRGLIAQDVQAQFPEAVDVQSSGYLSLDYGALISPVIGAVKELNSRQTTLDVRVTTIENQLSSLQVTGTPTFAGLNVTGTITANNLVVTNEVTAQKITAVAGITTSRIETTGTAPVAQPLPQSGTGATVILDGNDAAGTVTLTTGTNGTNPGDPQVTTGEQVAITFVSPKQKMPRVIVSPVGDAAGTVKWTVERTQTDFKIKIIDGVLPQTAYTFEYFVVE